MRPRAAAFALLLAFAAGPAAADDRPEATVPSYAAPPGASEDPGAPADAAVARVVATAGDLRAVRRLTRVGPAALPRIAAALRASPWRARAGLVAAVAEMDAPEATPLLVAASRDPSFAVREAAVIGLGKTGDARGAAALVARADVTVEPSWRVRVAAAAALRRGVLRGAVERTAGGDALVRLLDDVDPDAARAALDAVTPLAHPGALPRLVRAFGDRTGTARERLQALSALRAYREPDQTLLAALRRGFLEGSDPNEAVRAARALIDMRGASALDDEGFSASVLRHLLDEAARDMRDAIASLRADAKPWILVHLETTIDRVAAGRVDPAESPFEGLLDALFQVDEDAGVEFLRKVLAQTPQRAVHPETCRVLLRRAQFGYATRLGTELRAFLKTQAAQDVYADALRAVAASGGADLLALVESALRSGDRAVRQAALDALAKSPEVPTPPALVELATTATRPHERRKAIELLGTRDRAAAARAAKEILRHPDPQLRETAIREIDASRDPAYAEILRLRFREEDGRSSEAARTADQPPPAPSAFTGSGVTSTDDTRRATLRAMLLRALAAVAGADARADLLDAVLNDRDAKVRETAAQELQRAVPAPEDVPTLVARIAADPSPEVSTAVRRLVASLGDSPAAKAYFQEELGAAEGTRRVAALQLLTESCARVVPDGLVAALGRPDWTDEERLSALRILERADKRPPAEVLAAVLRAARTTDLVSETCRMLGSDPSPQATAELARFLAEDPDPQRRSSAVQRLGERRVEAALPAIVALLETTRPQALRVRVKTAPVMMLYRECAIALGRIGTEAAGRTLVAHLLSPELSALGAELSVPANGPFQPEESGIVAMIQYLAAGAAHLDDEILARLVSEELRARDGGADLDEDYVDGVARFLTDPEAYRLPPRRRTAAALPLWLLVAEGAPRWSSLDDEAWRRVAAELETQGRLAEALRATERAIAVADVEDAARSVDERRWEQGRLRFLAARVAAAAGKTDEAFAIATSIRSADPSDADLADLQGWCLVKIGRAGKEAEEALRAAAARDASSANIQFHLAYVVEQVSGPESALPIYTAAIAAERRRVNDQGRAEYLTTRKGLHHYWSHFFFWRARAAARTGQDGAAYEGLREAILHDDRYAAQALADPVFREFGDLAAVIDEALRRVRDARVP